MPDRVVITVTTGLGHFRRVRPLITAMAAQGIETWVLTDAAFSTEVVAAGGHHLDLYAGRPLEATDPDTTMRSTRLVTFAAAYADDLARQVADIKPSVMISDSFAVIGRVVAHMLQVPHVVFRSGHDVDPGRLPVEVDGARVTPRCLEAAETLRHRFGFDDASPWMWWSMTSPLLNLYGEPDLFISPEIRAVLEPIAFFGSWPDKNTIDRQTTQTTKRVWFPGPGTRVLISAGTIATGFLRDKLVDRMTVLADALAERRDISAVLSIGDQGLSPAIRDALTRPNVTVAGFVDQWEALGQAEVFITHHGLNSTHEAIFHGVPMISFPLLADQPAMAALCQRLGVAVPLAADVQSPIDTPAVHAALDAVSDRRADMLDAIDSVRLVERDTVDQRGAIVERILSLA